MRTPFQNYIACILLRFILPLLPLFIAYLYDNDVLARTFTLTLSIYIITQGLATKNVATLAFSLITGLLLISAYGAINKVSSAFPFYNAPQIYVLILFLAMHFVERYTRHVKDCEPFFIFNTLSIPAEKK